MSNTSAAVPAARSVSRAVSYESYGSVFTSTVMFGLTFSKAFTIFARFFSFPPLEMKLE